MGADVVRQNQRAYPAPSATSLDILKKSALRFRPPIKGHDHSDVLSTVSNMTITEISEATRALQMPIDVGGAYWPGKRVSLRDGGRAIFCVVPSRACSSS